MEERERGASPRERGAEAPAAPGSGQPRSSAGQHVCSQAEDEQEGIKPPRSVQEFGCYRDAGIEYVFKIASAFALYCWEQHFKSNFCFKSRISKAMLSQQSLLRPIDQG